jgi:hypothetical protein
MTLGEHFTELRRRLVRSAIALFVCMVAVWNQFPSIFSLIRQPYDSVQVEGSDAILALTGVTSGFSLQLRVSLSAAVVLSSPIWIYQLWRFISPGLKRNERKWAYVFTGVAVPLFASGVLLALGFGIKDAESLATIGAGACTFVVGPVTGTAVGASSDIIAISIGAGVIKSILVTIGTPLIAKYIGLDNPKSAMVFGGLLGTTSGVAAGLAATDPKLVPYGAMTATFYTGLGCLLCPSVLYFALKAITN